MGHQRLGTLPCTKKWGQVVGYIGAGAGAAQVATATLHATLKWLDKAHLDAGVVEAVRLLMVLPLAARGDDFADGLRARGLDVPDDPGLFDVLGATSAALDAATPNNKGRTDLGELAQMALGETLTAVVGGHLDGLFDRDPAEVRAGFARYATVKNFGHLAREFFARLTAKFLNSFLSRTVPLHAGPDQRFDTPAAVDQFDRELAHHCRERAMIVGRFSGEWLSKENYEAGGDITPERARDFVYGAMRKLTAELQVGGAG